ncbi:MAG: hypothetical protein KJ000_35970 [Pirellulaceae bacterium]|nr:hypothetical protein [Pirellulaceae bacterium]
MKTTNTRPPLQILREAVASSEMDMLLLGKEPYTYLPPSSPASGTTDLAELLRIAYEQWPEADRTSIRLSIIRALEKLVSTYDGLEPVAACLLIETLRQARNRSPMGIPVEELAKRLRESIKAYSHQLSRDYSGAGAEWKDGRLGELRRLSEIVRELGGTGFVDI